MFNIKKSVVTAALLLGTIVAVGHVGSASAATVTTTQQGMQQWRALNGKLIIVTGSYHDTSSYKRSLTFYFEEKPGGEWLHVPVIESEADHTLTLFSVSSGENTVEDALVITQGDSTYLVVAEKKAAGVSATWYKFSPAGTDFPDGPAFMFKPISTNVYAKSKNQTVEDVLQKEAKLKAKK
ncbi:hypothetical protein DUGA6_00860 [Duganella sp. HH105]|nr:hypothetical protein DUGA6_00860 [Duganella sp. HH105]